MCVSGCGKPRLLWADSSHHSSNEVHTTLPACLTVSRCDIVALSWRMGKLPTQTHTHCHSLPRIWTHTPLSRGKERRQDREPTFMSDGPLVPWLVLVVRAGQRRYHLSCWILGFFLLRRGEWKSQIGARWATRQGDSKKQIQVCRSPTV